MSDEKKLGNTDATQLGLPEVKANPAATQLIDSAVTTDPQITAPDIKPVAVLAEPPRAKTNETVEMPGRRKNTGAIPQAPQPEARRASKVVPATTPITDPQVAVNTAELQPVRTGEPFEWTMPRVAGVAGAVSLVFVLGWVFWPSGAEKRPVKQPRPEPEALAEPTPTPKPVAVKAPEPVKPVAPRRPSFALDTRQNVVDPFAVHLDDIPLNPAHRYRLRIERDDSRLGVALARLDEQAGWGTVRRMASHAALQFGGAKALRMHCEPGTSFADDATMPLELLDLATKKAVPVPLSPVRHCWDFEVGRMLELGEGVKKRVRVPTDATVKLGENVPLKVAYVLESLGEKKTWRTGVLAPGESLLAEGRTVRFALLDPYAGDNEGTLELELLEGDTESSGIVTPSAASGAQFVPVK